MTVAHFCILSSFSCLLGVMLALEGSIPPESEIFCWQEAASFVSAIVTDLFLPLACL